jgi:glycosyltransferase involved in cell wall biosynthesis
MLVSIITITYNSEEFLRETIRSVASQTYSKIEYIVVDGGSEDGTIEIIKDNSEVVTKYISEKDDGIYDALNKGMCMASGDLIGILHSDDFFVDEHVVGRYVNEFRNTDSELIYSNLYYVDKTGDKTVRTWRSSNYVPKMFRWGWMPPHPTLYIKRSVMDALGLYNSKFSSAGDYEYILRLMYFNRCRTSYLNIFSIKMRVGGESNRTLHNRLRGAKEDWRAWRVNGARPPFLLPLIKPLRKLGQFFGSES